MDSSKNSNKISDIVKLKQKLQKWRKQAHSSSNATTNTNTTTTTNNSNSNSTTKKGSLSRNNSDTNSNTTKKGSLSRNNSDTNSNTTKKSSLSRNNSIKGITFLKRTLSFTDISTSGVSTNAVPKGFLAVQVGEEMKRFVIPTNYLSHQAFSVLLKEAEEEFGFQQEGVLRIPCEVEVFENILKLVEAKDSPQLTEFGIVCGSSESQSMSQSHHPPSPMCR